MADGEHSTLFRVAFAVVETLAIVVGLGLTVFSLMAIVGEFTANFWVRLGIGVVVALFVPFLLADRFLPEGDRAARVRGLVTDVLAVTWLGFGFLFVVAAAPATGASLRKEADRFSERGIPLVDTVVSVLVGPPGEPGTGGSAAASTEPDSESNEGTSASADASAAARPDAGTDPTGDAASGTDGGAARAEDDEEEDEADDEEMDPGEVFKHAAPAVVSIRTQKPSHHPARDKAEGSGTGFFVDDGGIIGTNYHVIKGADSAEVKLWDGRKTDKVWVLARDKRLDLALLEIDFDDLEGEMNEELPGDDDRVDPLELGDSEDVEVGQRVIAIGNPLGLDHTLTDGLVSQRRVWRGRKMIQVSVPLSPGNSGGPLMNLHGEVIGVSTAKLGNAWNRGDSLNLAVPIGKLEELMDSDYPSKHRVGEGDEADKGTW